MIHSDVNQSGIQFPDTTLPDIVTMEDIGVTYDGGKRWVIQNFNLRIEDKPGVGEFIVVLGPSGCGKSTVLRFISGLQPWSSGRVLINSEPRSDKHPISMVFQQYSSLPWKTVLQNVMLPLEFQGKPEKECRELARQMIAMVGLEGHEGKWAKYPLLSGGQLQRVAIARSLIANPKIILMDEPFGALDTNTRFSMQMMLGQIWANLQSTVIFVTHDIREAVFLGDQIHIMSKDPGRIVASVEVDLPPVRDRETRRDPHFRELCDGVEDMVNQLAGGLAKE